MQGLWRAVGRLSAPAHRVGDVRPPTPPGADVARSARSRAATGRRGAARPRAGAGRRRDGQDPRRHPPDRPRRRHRRLRADRGAGAVLHHPRGGRDARAAAGAGRAGRAGPYVPLRRAAPAAVLLAAGAPARAARADPVQARDARPRRPAPAAGDRPGHPARPGERDRVGQGQQRLARHLRRPRPVARRSVSGLDPEVVARAFAAYEEVKRDQGRMDMEDVLLFGAGLLADNEAVAAQVRRQYKWFVVDEFQDVSPLQHALLDLWLGGRDELCVVGDPAQTIYSFAGADARYLREFTPALPLGHQRRAGPQLPLDPRGRGRRQPAPGRHREPGRRAGRAAPVRRGASPTARRPTRWPRPTPSPTGSPRCARRARRRAGWRCCCASTRSPSASRRRSPRAACPTSYAVRRGSSTGGEVRQAITLVRGAARSGEGSGPVADAVVAVLSQMGHSTQPPEGRGEVRNRWESLQALVDLAVRLRPRAPRRVAGRLRRRPRPPRRRAARPGRRRGHHRHHPLRQGPRVGRRLRRRHAREDDADLAGADPRGDRGGATPALRRDDPRPRRAHRVVGERPRAGRPGQPRPLAVPGAAARRRAGRLGAAPRAQQAQPGRDALPRVREPAGQRQARRRSAAAPTAPRPTTRRSSSGCGSGAWPARRRTASRPS